MYFLRNDIPHPRRVDPLIVAAFEEKKEEISLLQTQLLAAREEIAAIQFTPFSLAGISLSLILIPLSVSLSLSLSLSLSFFFIQ